MGEWEEVWEEDVREGMRERGIAESVDPQGREPAPSSSLLSYVSLSSSCLHLSPLLPRPEETACLSLFTLCLIGP